MTYKKLTKEKQKELQELIEEITKDAKEVVQDYKDNPSEMSGSFVHLHEDSPFLDKALKDDKWKRVVRHIPLDNKK